jgi:DNA-binding CsgD family transcriptional regulator
MQLGSVKKSGAREIDLLRRNRAVKVLTDAEAATYEYMKQGLNARQIADIMGLKYHTMSNRCRIIKDKMRWNDV